MDGSGVSLFRVFVPVTDLDASVEFYRKLLDDDGRSIRGGRHYFDCGSVILAIVANAGAPIADHLYFSATDIEPIYYRAQGLGCLEDSLVHDAPAGEIVVRPWGERSFYVRDPDGNGLCFVDAETLYTGL